MSMNEIHEKHWAEFMTDAHHRTLYDSWWTSSSVGYWRQTRLYAAVFEVLGGLKDFSWLTVGDGAGYDAWRLLQAGFREVLATDLDDAVLAETKAAGFIQNISIENAEALSFADNSFDFILCKEALHHMSRPYAAIYEMFRVARYGVVVIEPQDPWVDYPCRVDQSQPHYESVGNYVYQYSTRELEKIAYGLNIRGIASKKMMDVYTPGCEFAMCNDGDPIWESTRTRTEQLTTAMHAGEVVASYVQAVFFKNTVTPELFDMLAQQNPEWRFLRTDTNPFLNGKNAF
ncbi:class I SAM-dependent methyltransferase [Iodobacter sp. HSC-16F04]|uniref:Class I SAM-dependent methyltransferase n=1 Tax=Iodobacter violaceini TaxID=3044271 RepID=A0ABX0KXV2_9NEIS|nr:class I SAM-dependent methyltransferase [Iodobacter violacea]NHQ88659.1 class I SAM-dependent methyltransferase [Iodobacter violacea]